VKAFLQFYVSKKSFFVPGRLLKTPVAVMCHQLLSLPASKTPERGKAELHLQQQKLEHFNLFWRKLSLLIKKIHFENKINGIF
jgi:hypothetical protein